MRADFTIPQLRPKDRDPNTLRNGCLILRMLSAKVGQQSDCTMMALASSPREFEIRDIGSIATHRCNERKEEPSRVS